MKEEEGREGGREEERERRKENSNPDLPCCEFKVISRSRQYPMNLARQRRKKEGSISAIVCPSNNQALSRSKSLHL
jgi:hypothetical protein